MKVTTPPGAQAEGVRLFWALASGHGRRGLSVIIDRPYLSTVTPPPQLHVPGSAHRARPDLRTEHARICARTRPFCARPRP